MSKYEKGLVSIIIPTATRSKVASLKTFLKKQYLLQDAVRDIKCNVVHPHETIVICNSSDDAALVSFIQASRDIDKYSLNSIGVGVPRGWNMGAQMAEGEFLCFSSDDVEIGRGAIEQMAEVLSRPLVGEVGPMGGRWFRRTPGRRVGLDKIEEADEISGWLFMITRDAFDRVGGFDVFYTPGLCEEIDISFALRNAGYKCLVIPGLSAWHHQVSGMSATNTAIQCLHITITRDVLTDRNHEYFEQKWASFWKD